MQTTQAPTKTAVIAAIQPPDVSDEQHEGAIAELGRLLKTLGYKVVGVVSQRRATSHSAAVLGTGKLMELAGFTGGPGVLATPGPRTRRRDDDAPEGSESRETPSSVGLDGEPLPHADVVVVDHEISPRQARNLEQATGSDVLDRTGVIVEIFHRHARTRQARLQVEIARLSYVVPRLRAGVRGSDRQRGGVGGKGAGESSLELDRRKVRDRVAQLRAELAAVQREESTRRARRQGLRRVALVGYTNAGKSSLMRALTGSEVLVEDKLFATLGTTVRALQPETTPRILISDTVGFIKQLPHDLVASFRSTLDEALEASLLLYVVDASDPGFRSQLSTSRDVLGEIGADAVESRLVLNKMDLVDDETRAELAQEFPDAIQLSAHSPSDVAAMHERLVIFFEGAFVERTLFVPHANGKLAAEVRATTQVLDETHDVNGTHFEVRASGAVVDALAQRLSA